MQHLTYIGPFDEVELDVLGVSVRRGESVEVDDGLAGRTPTPAKGIEGADGYIAADPGVGLLAQPSNWVRSSTKAAKNVEEPPAPPPQPAPVTLEGEPIPTAEETA